MRQILLAIVMGLSLGIASMASAQGMCVPAQVMTRGDDGPVDPWPFGKELEFPWRGIQGTWAAEVDGCVTYFAFKTVRQANNDRVLNVREFDPVTCELKSSGVGFERSRVVRARMSGGFVGTYDMRIHVFNRADMKMKDKTSTPRTVYMLAMSPIWDNRAAVATRLTKVSNDANGRCNLE
ncbi:MAG: hypothetical protein ACK5P6_00670 [Pseudobdellovibrionaceae bacterium]